jgi:hypothetical protein
MLLSAPWVAPNSLSFVLTVHRRACEGLQPKHRNCWALGVEKTGMTASSTITNHMIQAAFRYLEKGDANGLPAVIHEHPCLPSGCSYDSVFAHHRPLAPEITASSAASVEEG